MGLGISPAGTVTGLIIAYDAIVVTQTCSEAKHWIHHFIINIVNPSKKCWSSAIMITAWLPWE
jgi:EAL domain-containing protein (putative c-di-GMP-specific phosphodiesterase class I)